MKYPGLCCLRTDCPDQDCEGVQIARLYEREGGHVVNDALVFPLMVDRDEVMPARFRTPPRSLLRAFLLARIAVIALIAVAAVVLQRIV